MFRTPERMPMLSGKNDVVRVSRLRKRAPPYE